MLAPLVDGADGGGEGSAGGGEPRPLRPNAPWTNALRRVLRGGSSLDVSTLQMGATSSKMNDRISRVGRGGNASALTLGNRTRSRWNGTHHVDHHEFEDLGDAVCHHPLNPQTLLRAPRHHQHGHGLPPTCPLLVCGLLNGHGLLALWAGGGAFA